MKFVNMPEELAFGVEQVCAQLQLENVDREIAFEKDSGMHLRMQGQTLVIGYDRIVDALRALTFVKNFDGKEISQRAKFDTLCTMVDCSRNAVLNVDAAKEFIVHLAMMGFNAMMLYTEDTYEIKEYPYFGHMRGRYTAAQLKELDAFGNAMGVEVIPCIQTLAHLNALTNWTCFRQYVDIADILLADDERTYQLIEAMMKTVSECFTTRRVHIGMDEAHLLGRGKHTDRFGYERKTDIMLRHLGKVVELCRKYGLEPVMWSDMFFRMQFDGKYRVPEGELSKEVTDNIPKDLALCYWEYYVTPKNIATAEHMFECHRKIGNEVWFAGGAWSWSGICPKNFFSMWVTPEQLRLAENYGVKHIIATCWGDDGAECTVFNMLPALMQYAQYSYGDYTDETMSRRFMDCFGMSIEDFLQIDRVGRSVQMPPDSYYPDNIERNVLYNDPLFGLMNWDIEQIDLEGKYAQDAAALERLTKDARYGYLFETQYRLARLLDKKVGLSRRIKALYHSGDKAGLQRVVEEDIPSLYDLLDEFIDAFRFQWHWVNKPFGFEIQDIRLGGLKQRLITAADRLQQYIDGDIEVLEELEQPDLPLSCNENKPTFYQPKWRTAATSSVITHN